MGFCKCKDMARFETVFGLLVFVVIVFAMKEQALLVFEQIEWYRALAVTLGGVTAAGMVGIVAGFSATWIFENIGLVVIWASIIWVIGFIVS